MPVGPTNTKPQKQKVVHAEMSQFKQGDLHSGSKSGPVVKNRKQAIAIALSESGQSNKGNGPPVKSSKGPPLKQGHHRMSGHPGAHRVGSRKR